jgi:hypothetical protein
LGYSTYLPVPSENERIKGVHQMADLAAWLSVGLGISVIALLIVYLIWSMRRRQDLESIAFDLRQQYRSLFEQLGESSDTGRDRDRTVVSAADLKRIADGVTRSLEDSLARISENASAPQSDSPVPQTTQDAHRLLNEINHSLSTPLAQIELILNRMLRAQRSAASRVGIESALRSVDISRAVVAAYRDISSIALEVDDWDIDDLDATIRSAANLYLATSEAKKRKVQVQITAPKVLNGGRFTNYFLLTIILPLLQNAFESATQASTVSCEVTESDAVYIRIVNQVLERPDLKVIEERGYSTKGDEHTGIGLPSVRTLISRTEGASFTVDCDDGDVFRAEVKLPIPR